MSKGESIHEYFTRFSQFKEQLEAIEDKIDEIELVMVLSMVLLDHDTPSSRQYMQGQKD